MRSALNRRTALQGLGVLAAAASGAGAAPALAATPGAPDFTDPAQRLRAYMLMRGALDERPVVGCVSGQYFGVVDGELRLLFGVVGMTVARYRRRGDGGYDAFNGEVAYFTDIATGRALDRWHNPYTDATVKVPQGGLPPSRFIIGADCSMILPRSFAGGFSQQVQPIEVRGDDVWLPELTITSAAPPGQAKSFRYAERTTLHARLSDLTRPGAMQVGADTAYTNIVSWRPWMAMGDRPGNLTAIGAGRYGASAATLPAGLIAALRERRPAVLADPASLIEPIWSTR